MNLSLLLAYTPFLDPLPLSMVPPWWAVLIVLVVLISVAYKTIKLPHLRDVPWQTLMMSVQILAFMVLASALIWLLTEIA